MSEKATRPRAGAQGGGLLRRHWRVLAVTLLLMVATSLLAALADRGHDPEWRRELPDEVSALSFTPDGERLLALQTRNGSFTALTALTPRGERAWTVPLNVSYVKFAAANEAVAVATAPSPANLTVYDALTGRPFWYAPIPRVFVTSLAMDGDLLAVALQTTPPGVQVFTREGDGFLLQAELPFPSGPDGTNQVRGLDVRDGTVAAGDDLGNVKALRGGALVLEARVPYQALALEVQPGGAGLLVGGRSLDGSGFTGGVQALRITPGDPLGEVEWTAPVPGTVTFLDVSHPETGTARAVALVDAGPPILRGFPDLQVPQGWSTRATRVISDLLPNRAAALALDPKGETVAYVTAGDEVTVLSAAGGEEQWTYRAFGGTSLSYHPEGGAFATGVRLLPDLPPNVVLYFDVEEEPLSRDLSRLLPLVLALEALVGLGVLGVRALGRSG
ncbi:MAG TPA: hypothetical protein VNZ52_03290 [Candidatus Thermoplasmatota archaeon]|nr:hypothetical protein [Candidatus Thermoplasmatota archaeon]